MLVLAGGFCTIGGDDQSLDWLKRKLNRSGLLLGLNIKFYKKFKIIYTIYKRDKHL